MRLPQLAIPIWPAPSALALALAAGLVLATPVVAQEIVVYPAKGQSAEQTEKDKFGCYGWAKGQSGFDPMAPPTATSPPPQKEAKQGGVGRGALGGLAVGTAVGAIRGGGGKKSRAIGAAAGGLVGGMRRNSQNKREAHNREQWEQEQMRQYSAGRNNYNRNYAACLEGRGYSVR